MNTRLVRILFFSLLMLFLLFTGLIASVVTSTDPGINYRTEKAKAGKLLFQKYNCGACHQIYGLGGYMGPDLTNVMSATGKGETYVQAFLKSGSKRMPNFHLTENEITELSAFLNYIDHTGISPVHEYTINYNGTVNYKSK